MTDQRQGPLDGEITSHLRRRSDEIVLPVPDPLKPAADARRATRRRIGAGVGALAVTALAVGGLTTIGSDDGGDDLASEAADVESVDEETAADADAALAIPTSGLSFGGGSTAAAFGLDGEAYVSSISAMDGGWLAVVQRWEEDKPGGGQVELLRSTDGENWESSPGPDTGPDEQIHSVVVEGDVMVATGESYPEGFFEAFDEGAGYPEPSRYVSPAPMVWASTDGGASWSASELVTDTPDLPAWAHVNTWVGNAAIHGSTMVLTGSSYVDLDVASLLGEEGILDYGYGWSTGPDGEFQVEIWRGEDAREPEIYTASDLGVDRDLFELLGQGSSVIWQSTDGATWDRQNGPDQVQLEQIVAVPGGLYSVGYLQYNEFEGYDEGVEPESEGPSLWHSADGSSWEKVDGLPVDGETYIQQVFEFDGDIAIVTEEWPNGPTVWRFDGLTWHREPVADLVITGEDEQLYFEQVESGPAGTLVIASLQKQSYGPEPLVDEIVIEKNGLFLHQPVFGPETNEDTSVFATIEDADGNVLAEYSYEDSGPDGPAGVEWVEEGNSYYTIYSDPETGDEFMRLDDREMGEAWQQAYPEDAYDNGDEYSPPRRMLIWRSAEATEWQVLDQADALGFEGWTQAVAVGETQVMIVLQEEMEHDVEMPAVYEEFELAMQENYERFDAGEITEEELMEAEEALHAEFEARMDAAEELMPQPETRVFVGSLD